jgi:hypothetical protein
MTAFLVSDLDEISEKSSWTYGEIHSKEKMFVNLDWRRCRKR